MIYYETMKPFKERIQEIGREKKKNKKEKEEDILKDGFSPMKIEGLEPFDVIIIGSGMGGLTAGALLSRIGFNITTHIHFRSLTLSSSH